MAGTRKAESWREREVIYRSFCPKDKILRKKVVEMKQRDFKSIRTYFIGGMLLVIAIVMSVQAAVSIYSFKSSMEANTRTLLTHQAGEITGAADAQLGRVAKYAELMSYNIQAMPTYDGNVLLGIVENYINSEPLIIGAGVWFEPYAFQPDMKYYGPYKYKDEQGKAVTTWDFSNAEYDYFKYDWYKNGLAAKEKVVWSEPYEDTVTKIAMITITSPIKKENRVIGVTTVDIGLNALSEYVKNIKVGQSGYAFVVDKTGMYLGHKDKANLQEKITDDADPAVKDLGTSIINAVDSNIVKAKVFGKENFITYAPIGTTGLKLVLVYPEEEAFRDLNAVIYQNVGAFVISVVLIALVLAWLFNRKIGGPVENLRQTADKIATGDLSVQARVESQDELGSLAGDINEMIKSLRGIIGSVAQSAEQLAASGEELNASAEQSAQAASQVADSVVNIARSAEKQRSSLNDTTNVVDKLAQSINQAADDSLRVAGQSLQAAQTAQAGADAVNKAVTQMSRIENTVNESAGVVAKLGDRSKEIGQIVEAISGIAGQTNLLALNAAIEAARAGEQGRGFAVVAEEVRKLAEQSQEAAKQITGLIQEIQSDTEQAVTAMNNGTREVKLGTQVVDTAGTAFAEIVGLITAVADKINGITETMKQMETGSRRIVASVKSIDEQSCQTASEAETVSAATQEQSASMEEIASASQTLSQMAMELQNVIGKFHV